MRKRKRARSPLVSLSLSLSTLPESDNLETPLSREGRAGLRDGGERRNAKDRRGESLSRFRRVEEESRNVNLGELLAPELRKLSPRI
jgi:hypothetical protein